MARFESIARPYAKAAFLHAKREGTLPLWRKALGELTALLEEPQIQAVLAHPQASFDQRGKLFYQCLSQEVQTEAIERFVDMLARNGRLPALADISDQFTALYRESENILLVTVTSAFPLSEAHQAAIKELFARKKKQTIELALQEDKSLIGGAIISASGMVYDASLKGKLERLKQALTT